MRTDVFNKKKLFSQLLFCNANDCFNDLEVKNKNTEYRATIYYVKLVVEAVRFWKMDFSRRVS